MELLLFFWDLLVNLDKHLASLLAQYGVWVYLLLFLIVFCETGLVVTPFLPGDSLLFIAGALTAPGGGAGQLDLLTLNLLLIAAAVLGNTTNYWIGRYFGPKVFGWEDSRFFNRRAFDKAHGFYERHGGKTIVITRFLPILRTFAPFVAGVAQMTHARFQAYNVSGGVLWVTSLSVAGYLFGNIPWVRDNLTLIILTLIIVPGLPALVMTLRTWHEQRRARLAGRANS
ncbi:MAG: DedA family protein [Betaproteobacteria bacterium]|nr:MAG: DedA family protein [Betaproteobacteria bacterium]